MWGLNPKFILISHLAKINFLGCNFGTATCCHPGVMIKLNSVVLGVRCRDLDRYMKRLARHPTIRKDPDFRIFLQEVKLSGTLEVKTTIGQSITATIDRWNNKTNK